MSWRKASLASRSLPMVREARTSTHELMDGYQVKDNDYHAGLEYPSCTKSSLGSWKVFEEAMPCCRIIPRLHGEGNGNPLQCSCLENCRDWGAWWAAIYGVAQSQTRLKQLSSSSRSGLQGLSRWLSCKESVCQAGDIGENPDPWRCPGEGNGNPLQYSCLGNPMDRGAWRASVHEVAKE